MNNNPHASPEADRKAYQVLSNVASMHRYQSQRQLLEQKKDELAQLLMAEFSETVTVQRLETTIRCAKQRLNNGYGFEQVIEYSRKLLTDTPA